MLNCGFLQCELLLICSDIILCNILKYHLNANYSRKRNFPLKESLEDAMQLLQNIQWDIQFSE